MSSKNRFKCRFGCSHTFKTESGRNYHEEKMHGIWVTPTSSSKRQTFTLSHVFDWSRNVTDQLKVMQDRLSVDSCFSEVN